MTTARPAAGHAAVARRARLEPSRLGRGNLNLWDDLREVLLDPAPDPRELETLRRWLRDVVDAELRARLGRGKRGRGAGLVRWACRLAPEMIWKLPHSRAEPSPRHHRRIVAILLPHQLARLEETLRVWAFQEGLRGSWEGSRWPGG